MSRRAGYLLIEIVIALAIAVTMSTIVAFMHATVMRWQQQATQQMIATNLAISALSSLQSHQNKYPTMPGFTINTKIENPDPSIPFGLATITVQFKNPQGVMKQVTLTGGVLHARS